MRILLISANQEPFPEPVFPAGAAYVAGALERAGAAVRIFDLRYGSLDWSLPRVLAEFRPDRIGLSLRNVDNAAFPSTRFYLPSYAALVRSLRAVTKVPIVLGGPAFSLFPREIAAVLRVDCGVIGEGEASFGLFAGRECTGVRRAGPADIGEVAFPKDMASVFPRFRRYRTVGIQTARGCPNQCIYCTYPRIEGAVRRRRPPGAVAEEIAQLRSDHGVRNFFIVDSLFNADEGHMAAVLERIVERNLPIRLSCYLHPRVSDPSLFRLLRRAGCVAVDFGTDSGSPAVLRALGKPFTVDDIRKASRACRDAGIDCCHSLILGGPGETRETLGETVRLMDELAPRAVVAMTGVRIYPGTAMERIARDEGAIGPGTSLLEPRFYFSGMGAMALVAAAAELAGRKRNWFFPGRKDWSATLGYRILHLLYRRGPLWRTFGRPRHAGRSHS